MGTKLKQIAQNVAMKEFLINEINQALSPAGKFGRRNIDNPGLYFYYYGGRYATTSGVAVDIADGQVLCVANTTNYVEYQINTGVVVNQTGYTVGNIAIARCVTNASTIVDFYNDVIDAFLPTGTSPALASGGGSSLGFGDISIINNLVGPSPGNTLFTVKGGKNWGTGKGVYEGSAVTVPDYSSSSNFTYLSANTVYYVYLNLETNAIASQMASSVLNSIRGNAKLLWIIETDATKISKVTDYRAMCVFIKNKTLLKATQIFNTTTATSYDFNMSDYVYQIQVADSSTGVNPVLGQYPRYLRPYTSLLCVSAEKGYLVGEEADYVTSNDGIIWGKPLRMANNGTVNVYQGSQLKVWNRSTDAWETPTNNCWGMVLKLDMEYHS